MYILQRCPSDYNKYFGIGIIIFLTGIMASISGAYALFTVFNSALISLVFGLFWGVVIFFLDWYLVSSMKKEKKPAKEIAFSVPRIVLAVFLALIISKPLELKLFDKEIEQTLHELQHKKTIAFKESIGGDFAEIETLKKENQSLKSEIKQKEEERNTLFDMIIAEAEGKSPTGKAGKGPVYQEKKAQYDKIEQELMQIKNRNLATIDKNNARIDALKQKRSEKISGSEVINQRYDGFLARIEAMGILSEKNTTIRFTSLFIMLLFITIESAPVLVKLISSRGPYDQMLEAEEYSMYVESKKNMYHKKSEGNTYLEHLKHHAKMKAEAGIKANREYINRISAAQSEINRKKVELWKDKEINELKIKTLKLNLTNDDWSMLN